MTLEEAQSKILELQEEIEKNKNDMLVLEDALTKKSGEVDKLKETNQKYYEKLIDKDYSNRNENIQEEEQNKEAFKSVDDLSTAFLGKE